MNEIEDKVHRSNRCWEPWLLEHINESVWLWY